MNVHRLRAIAGTDAARFAPAGDNLIVDFDLSERTLPVGSLLTIGKVVVARAVVPGTLRVGANVHVKRPGSACLA
ncbi:MAG: hypothetical protein NTZ61_00935 [Proteobacteria bacterium]|nr:hypothetical protein [Pseudomonadota bacterium]